MSFAMTDKLHALRRGGSDYGREPPLIGTLETSEESEHINKVLTSVDEVTQHINQIARNVERIKENQAIILTSFQNQAARDDNERLNEEIKQLSHKVHNQLKKMKAVLESEETGQTRNTADFRIKKAQYTTITRRFKDVMEEYNDVQEKYRDKSKERIQKQLQYAGKNVSEDQLEKMLESDDPQIFTQDIMLETAQKRAALGEVEARHVDIMLLERNIRELHEMFYDMALLVEEQGELVDRIERNVENAGVYVYHGEKRIRKAVVVSSRNRRLKWVICCVVSGFCLLLLIVIAVIALVVYFVTNRNSS